MKGKILWKVLVALLSLVLLASLALSACAAPAPGKTVIWKFASQSTEGSFPVKTLRWWAEEMKKRTSGQIQIDLYVGGASPYKADETLKTLRENLMEGGEVWAWAVGGEVPESKVTSLPGLIPFGIKFREKLGREFEADFQPILAKHNAYLYAFFESSERNMYLKKAANTMAELAGKKLRSSGKEEQELTNKMGAVGTVIPGAEIYNALQVGTIDGAWHIDDTALASKWYEVTNYVVDLRWGGNGCFMSINNTALNALPDNLKKVVIDTQKDFKDQLFKNIAVATEESRAGLLKGGMKEVKWAKADMDKLAQLSDAINQDYYKSAPPEAKKIYDRVREFIAKNPAGN